MLTVAGAGKKGVDELAKMLDPAVVTFALVRVPFGTGTFVRNKCLLLHVNSG